MRVFKIISFNGDLRIVEAETRKIAVELFEKEYDESCYVELLSESSVMRREALESKIKVAK